MWREVTQGELSDRELGLSWEASSRDIPIPPPRPDGVSRSNPLTGLWDLPSTPKTVRSFTDSLLCRNHG